MVNEFNIYKIMEFVIFSSYLVFVFFAVQIWFLWRDIDKKEVKIDSFLNETFFRKNCIYIFSFSIFFIIRALLEITSLPNAMIYYKLFEMMGFISIVLLTHNWYSVLRASRNRKCLPFELTNITFK